MRPVGSSSPGFAKRSADAARAATSGPRRVQINIAGRARLGGGRPDGHVSMRWSKPAGQRAPSACCAAAEEADAADSRDGQRQDASYPAAKRELMPGVEHRRTGINKGRELPQAPGGASGREAVKSPAKRSGFSAPIRSQPLHLVASRHRREYRTHAPKLRGRGRDHRAKLPHSSQLEDFGSPPSLRAHLTCRRGLRG